MRVLSRQTKDVLARPCQFPYFIFSQGGVCQDLSANRVSPGAGFGVTVRLPGLIEKVFVSPEFPSGVMPHLRQMVDAAGLTAQIGQPDLLKPPNRECDEAFKRTKI